MNLLAILIVCLGWYGPGGGALSAKNRASVARKPETTVEYRHLRGVNELKVKEPARTRTYRWRGPVNHRFTRPNAKWTG